MGKIEDLNAESVTAGSQPRKHVVARIDAARHLEGIIKALIRASSTGTGAPRPSVPVAHVLLAAAGAAPLSLPPGVGGGGGGGDGGGGGAPASESTLVS